MCYRSGMKKVIPLVCVVLLFILAVYSFVYINYHPDISTINEISVGNPEMSDIKVSKILVEALKKVVITFY